MIRVRISQIAVGGYFNYAVGAEDMEVVNGKWIVVAHIDKRVFPSKGSMVSAVFVTNDGVIMDTEYFNADMEVIIK